VLVRASLASNMPTTCPGQQGSMSVTHDQGPPQVRDRTVDGNTGSQAENAGSIPVIRSPTGSCNSAGRLSIMGGGPLVSAALRRVGSRSRRARHTGLPRRPARAGRRFAPTATWL
jgi:hypothetical protein